MVIERATQIASGTGKRDRGWWGRVRAYYYGSEAFRGYSLLSPTLLVMLFSMCVPFALMVLMSFWTQVGYEFDTALTLDNYAKVASQPVYAKLLMRSLWISAACTFATVIISYPMA